MAQEKDKKPAGKFIVEQEFHDIVDFSKIHKPGDDVSSFDPKRLQELVESGLVKEEK